MKINIPFVYDVRVILPRHQLANNMNVLAWETFDIAEVNNHQAPIAIKANATKIINYGQIAVKEKINLYRLYDNNLVRDTQSIDFRNLQNDVGLNKLNLQSALNNWSNIMLKKPHVQNLPPEQNCVFTFDKTLNCNTVYVSRGASKPILEENNFNYRELLSSNRSQCLQELKQKLTLCCFVDNVLYTPSDGPGWTSSDHHERVGDQYQLVRLHYLVDELKDVNPNNRKYYFSVYNYQDFLDSMDRKNQTLENQFYREETVGDFEILIKDKNNLCAMILESCEKTLKTISADIGLMQPYQIRNFASVKDSVMNFHTSMGDVLALNLLNETIGFVKTWTTYKDSLNEDKNISLKVLKDLEKFLPAPVKVLDPKHPDAVDISLEDLEELENSESSFKI